MSLFRVESALVDGVERVSLIGELDRAVLRELELALLAADGRPVVLDLTACDFIDSSGIAFIVRQWRQRKRRLILTGARSQTARILQITGIDESIGMFKSLEEACAALEDDEHVDAGLRGDSADAPPVDAAPE
jgi:anti-anti-sigma factor